MYDFAVVALLALATLKLVDFLSDAIPQLRNLRSFLTFVLGVGATVALVLVTTYTAERKTDLGGHP